MIIVCDQAQSRVAKSNTKLINREYALSPSPPLPPSPSQELSHSQPSQGASPRVVTLVHSGLLVNGSVIEVYPF